MIPLVSSDKITVSGTDDLLFSLYDISGKQVLSKATRQTETIDISGFSGGMYFYKVTSDKQQVLRTGKLVIQ